MSKENRSCSKSRKETPQKLTQLSSRSGIDDIMTAEKCICYTFVGRDVSRIFSHQEKLKVFHFRLILLSYYACS